MDSEHQFQHASLSFVFYNNVTSQLVKCRLHIMQTPPLSSIGQCVYCVYTEWEYDTHGSSGHCLLTIKYTERSVSSRVALSGQRTQIPLPYSTVLAAEDKHKQTV